MKTKKQIRLLMEEKGMELEKRSQDMDKIIIPQDVLAELPQKYKAESINAIPILRKGVLVQKGENFMDYLTFEVTEFNEDSFIIHCDTFQPYLSKRSDTIEKRGMPLWSYSADVRIFNGEDVTIYAENFENATSEIYRKQKMTQKAEQYIQENINEYTLNVIGFIQVMSYINYLSEHPEIKVIEKKEGTSQSSARYVSQDKNLSSSTNSTSTVQSRPSQVRTIKLNGIKIISSNQKLQKKLVRKKRQRLTGSWSVRGHYRHYKNGKKTYINPYVKGVKKGSIVPKEYKLT